MQLQRGERGAAAADLLSDCAPYHMDATVIMVRLNKSVLVMRRGLQCGFSSVIGPNIEIEPITWLNSILRPSHRLS